MIDPEIIIDYKNKYLTIKVHPKYNYDISFERLRKKEQWRFDHLCGKICFTPKTKVEFGRATQELRENNYGKSKNG